MEQITLKELKMSSRTEAIGFLKKLWNSEKSPCPICGSILEPLHKKAKKSDCDWQCKTCDKTFRTINLLYEINEKMPD
ncbi:MAG: hypothetical protein KBT31_01965 [Firmicutes bacterium]|nr:hypothetical protein [Candidatus Colimorpha enterica]